MRHEGGARAPLEPPLATPLIISALKFIITHSVKLC